MIAVSLGYPQCNNVGKEALVEVCGNHCLVNYHMQVCLYIYRRWETLEKERKETCIMHALENGRYEAMYEEESVGAA